MRDDDDEELGPLVDHPFSEDVSLPVFAMVALIIFAMSLAAFGAAGHVSVSIGRRKRNSLAESHLLRPPL
jgi:hypothetical protein